VIVTEELECSSPVLDDLVATHDELKEFRHDLQFLVVIVGVPIVAHLIAMDVLDEEVGVEYVDHLQKCE
jgi:hypothetical protein